MAEHINSFTFYSYKGGSGRSTTAINTVRHLADVLKASPEHPILLVDTDLESAGLTYFFNTGNQNPFTDLFSDTIHTTRMILNPEATYLENYQSELRIFQNKSAAFTMDWTSDIDSTLAEELAFVFSDFFPNSPCTSETIRAMLNGVRLTRAEKSVLSEYCEAYKRTTAGFQDDIDAEKDQKRVQLYRLPLKRIGGDLLDIHHNMELTDDQKAEATEIAIRKRLPATSFLDISSHFGKDKGTIRFLGVDIAYEGAQIVRDENTTSNFRRLIDTCEDYGYCAIVFDSGAGVQSSAEALHEVSDVLVYCMRPTKQFRSGTEAQLSVHSDFLEKKKINGETRKAAGDKYKPIVLLPTAVPMYAEPDDNSDYLCVKRNAAIEAIAGLARRFGNIVNDTFCSKDSVLNEVELFKWEERILLSEEQIGGVADQLRAFRVYGKLAEKICELSLPAKENQAEENQA
ncbi:MAG: hypothetical protein E7605_00255 [Ruminococcaceae bacterium]|nr:hypothetical protein [Oscillospiraceae bacterium]